MSLELKSPVSFLQYFISQGLFRLPTPIFFSISGYLFFLNMKGKQSEFILKFKKRIKTIVIPYLFWSTSGVLIYFALQIIPQSRAFFNKELVINYSLLKLLNTIFFNPVPGQLWYLRDLIMLVFLSPIK
jgi:surface polysaccharide O-acyltransferase-like enzyme